MNVAYSFVMNNCAQCGCFPFPRLTPLRVQSSAMRAAALQLSISLPFAIQQRPVSRTKASVHWPLSVHCLPPGCHLLSAYHHLLFFGVWSTSDFQWKCVSNKRFIYLM